MLTVQALTPPSWEKIGDSTKLFTKWEKIFHFFMKNGWIYCIFKIKIGQIRIFYKKEMSIVTVLGYPNIFYLKK